MLAIGAVAPDFALPDQDGREQRLSKLLNGQALILYFYPADFTPGCTKEACDLRDLHTRILSAGLRVVGVSPQNPESSLLPGYHPQKPHTWAGVADDRGVS